jgi:hypothetical protein
MKHQAKLILFGILSLSIGVAFASPLLVSELNIIPFIKHVQGPTADFSVNVAYANFTIINGSKPVSENDGPAIAYYVVLNVTNLSGIGATLIEVNFIAAEKITMTSSAIFFGTGTGYQVEGAWVDGVWYNVTYVTGEYPTIASDGSIIEHSLLNSSWFTPYWMEGVRIVDMYDDNCTLTATYMDMNGTWTNVTGRINFTRPEGTGISFSINNAVVRELHVFQALMPSNTTTTDTFSNGTSTDSKMREFINRKDTWVGDGLFNNYWAPHQSRLIVLQGTYDIIKPWVDAQAIDTLKSGSVTLQTRLLNGANITVKVVNGTVMDTWSYATECKQVQLTQNGDSYIYNAILGENQIFLTDQYGVEVFIETRR